MSTVKPNPDAAIVCEHVSVAYGHEEVLHDVCLEIQRGAFMPFVGPNGAGKTTLLRAILGLLKPRRGRILTPFHRSPPGYVPQQKSIDPLYPVSVRQIVTMGLYPQVSWWRKHGSTHKETVQHALEQFGLADHSHKTYAELSGGMRQKSLIARAFASGAEVFVMDEPTSELDEDSETEVLDHLFRLSQKEGKTVLLAHHGLDHVTEQVSMLCVVNHGRVQTAKRGEADLLRADRQIDTESSPPQQGGNERA
ncbi:MAG: ATP-binding cassette domain-containing protein [Planctomycetota bacterium]|nr:ATP-binding cassette domain-containing protein [Planctomycetota bacterium]